MTDLSFSQMQGESGPSRRQLEHERRLRRKRRRRRTRIVLAVCLVLFAGAAFAVYGFVKPLVDDMNKPTDYAGPGTGEAQVQILQGDSGRAIGQRLEKAGVVLTAEAFVDAAKENPDAGSIQPGTYQLKKEMKASEALNLLLDPASRISITVQLREGLRLNQIFEIIQRDTGFTKEQLDAAVKDPSVKLPKEANGNAEGYLFPATYTFDSDVTPVQLVAAMVARYEQAVKKVGIPPAQSREILTKASVIQAEGRNPDDMAKISTVIDNRLAKGMKLQMDSTVNYGTGKTGITTTPADRAKDTPYNTYLYPGLPAGPINSPGENALNAAINPEPGPWLFFVTVNPDTGETKFASTEAEHQANVKEFQQWLQQNG